MVYSNGRVCCGLDRAGWRCGVVGFQRRHCGQQHCLATDFVGGFNATPAGTIPKYVAGNGGGTAAGLVGTGILKAGGSSNVLCAGFTSLSVASDVDLNATPASTAVLVRNGHLKMNFNIYTAANRSIYMQMMDATTSITTSVQTVTNVLSSSAGWQHVEAVWDGSSVSILVGGVAQTLVTGGTSKILTGLVSLPAPDADMGIGGLYRNVGTTGQYLNGSIDNLVISGAIPEPASFSLITIGYAGIILFRRL